MSTKLILLILSWAALIAGIVLIVLHYTVQFPVWWGSAFLAVGAILSLVAVLLRKHEREEAQRAQKARPGDKKK